MADNWICNFKWGIMQTDAGHIKKRSTRPRFRPLRASVRSPRAT